MKPAAQRGFALVELTAALALSLLLAVWAASQWARQADELAARASGQWMAQVRHALEQAVLLDLGGWRGETPDKPVFARPATPALAELRQAGLLPAGFPDHAPLGFGVRLMVLAAAACPGAGCRVDALVVAGLAWRLPDGRPDVVRLAPLLQELGARGGLADDRLRGAQFAFPNPPQPGLPLIPAGTPLAWAGSSGGLDPRYVHRGDARDPQLRGSLSVAGSVMAGERLAAGGTLWAGARRTLGQACLETGALAQGDAGELLQCHRGRWRPGEGAFGGAFARNNRYGCALYSGESARNPLAGRCACPAGFAAVPVSSGGKWTETEGWTTGFVCVRALPGS
ncbi:pilus assembly protein [Bordetella trematum]|uniref:Type IV pilus-associated protein n=1 Tax=Bordetella trematum TaxID=123899 RepID=A0A157LLU7_9BORD|nr:prepilin-type N-terminal cleavage/methylation domain-containing protein [Bordetella trematum]AZR94730.1 pilus assembly protein [Bordetella trematum]NNH19493.1 prepilin-type N-terminal cleavage/methylation domain-containing protein [Bordetella trematum]SAH97590.1 type IV pilus-associated protein [Bordetella trematum]SAI74110.1 type IV pilus-associated protein [Bordetella trematum]SUV97007.1 type IV pilus-associated protein [Bordetella trematum]